jgi:signal peptidase I
VGRPTPGVRIALAAVAAAWAVFRWRPFRIEVQGPSMAPTLRPRDFLVAVRVRRLHRGDLAVVQHPTSGFELVKRIVGLPGERIRTDGQTVWVDGQLLVEPYAGGSGPPGEWALGPGEYLVLGDDRRLSSDGRSFGGVDRRALVGRAVLRYWPRPRLL